MYGIGTVARIFGVKELSEDAVGACTVIAAWLYCASLEASTMQATVGKAVVDLRVTDQTGSRISFWRASCRHFAKIASTITLGFGWLMITFTERRQSLHDKLAGCVIVVN